MLVPIGILFFEMAHRFLHSTTHSLNTLKKHIQEGLYIHDNIHLMLYANAQRWVKFPKWLSYYLVLGPLIKNAPTQGLYPTHKVQATSSIKVL